MCGEMYKFECDDDENEFLFSSFFMIIKKYLFIMAIKDVYWYSVT